MTDIEAILSKHFLMRELPKADLERLSRIANTRKYKAGERVFMKGDPGNAMMAVMTGRIRICCYSADGREVVLNVIPAGEVFGEIGLIDGGERTADAFAMEMTELLILSRRDFLPFLEHNPKVCVHMLEMMCHRLRWTSAQVEDFTFLPLPARLAKKLLYLADAQEPSAPDLKTVCIKLPQHLLASMIGTSREAVNKQLRAWEEDEVIDLRRGSVTIRDRDFLQQIVDACI